MKFGKQLERHKVTGWEAFYIDYGGLKRSLKDHYGALRPRSKANDGASSSEGSPRGEHECKISDQWFEELSSCINRVNYLLTSTAGEVEARLSAAQDDLKQASGSHHEPQLRMHLQSLTQQLQSKILDLRHFLDANHTAVYKILKKHDKQTGLCTLPTKLKDFEEKEPFNDHAKARLERLKCQLREFADQLGLDGDLQMNSPHDKSVTENLWALARISFSLGVISMALIVLAVLSGMEPQINHYSVEDLAATIPVLRLSFMMSLTAWLAGACASIFERYNINYLFLLDISPDLDVSAISLLNYASVQTGVWIVLTFCFLADMKFGAVLFNIHPEIQKLGWSLAHVYSFSVLMLQLCITSWWVSRGARQLFSRLILRVFCFSLLGEVSFAENIFADFLTSFGRPLKDVAYTSCYFRNWQTLNARDIRVQCKQDKGLAWAMLQLILVLPLVFRIAQCLRRMHDTGDTARHVLNCVKYCLAIIVSLLAAVHQLPLGLAPVEFDMVRMLSYIAATSYAATWDIVVDFGLTVSNRHRLYPRHSYAVLAFVDVALRTTWLLTYLPDCHAFVRASTFNRECFAFMISSLELIRRAVWAAVRIEHEHQSNAGRFRSVCWVPPLEHRRPVESDEHKLHLQRKKTSAVLVPLSPEPQSPVQSVESTARAGAEFVDRTMAKAVVPEDPFALRPTMRFEQQLHGHFGKARARLQPARTIVRQRSWEL